MGTRVISLSVCSLRGRVKRLRMHRPSHLDRVPRGAEHELATDDVRISDVPVIIADRSPHAFELDLNPPFKLAFTGKPQLAERGLLPEGGLPTRINTGGSCGEMGVENRENPSLRGIRTNHRPVISSDAAQARQSRLASTFSSTSCVRERTVQWQKRAPRTCTFHHAVSSI